MTDIFEWPHEWYIAASASFRLLSNSQVSPRPWLGGKNVYGPHAQLWVAKATITPQYDPDTWQAMLAFFSRLDGQAGVIRIGDPARRDCLFNRDTAATSEAFSDGTFFTDGTGFANGLIAPTVYVAAAANRGDRYVTLGGFPVSTAKALRRGDLFEIQPNGAPAQFPHLYEVMFDCASDANGKLGIEIRPRLRAGIAIGDQVKLSYPTSVFRAVDDNQAEAEITPPTIANFGFQLIEAIDLA